MDVWMLAERKRKEKKVALGRNAFHNVAIHYRSEWKVVYHCQRSRVMAPRRLQRFTYQLNSPMGLDLKLPKRTLKESLKEPLKVPLERSPSVLALGHLQGKFIQL